ncbi:MAG: F0F1 ATP synthase subunit A [Acholeplasmatales bacterium]|nr:F0F1 ATP synthase subunit A [Acholeplasmatales bacterium]
MDWSNLKDYTIKGPVMSTLIICGALIIFFFILFFILRKIDPLKKTPLWLVPFIWLVDMMNNFVKVNIGKRWKAYAPWFLTLTIFIFFANTSSVYLLENPTSYVVVTFALALCTFIIIQATGIISLGPLGYLKSFTDPMPVMTPMNIVSEFTLPISLSLRLFGNVISGVCVSILIKKMAEWFAIPIMPFINLLFDIAFSLIQVAVFVILSVIFTSMKIKDEEKIYSK